MVMIRNFLCLNLRITTILVGWIELFISILSLILVGAVFSLRDWLIQWLWTVYNQPVDLQELETITKLFNGNAVVITDYICVFEGA